MKHANLAICVPDEADNTQWVLAGVIGVTPVGQSINKKRVKMVGYWVGEPYWGRGIVTEALHLMTEYAFSQHYATLANDGVPVSRLEAGIFEYNPASGRVLQKNGYKLEAIQQRAYFKGGKDVSAHLYVKLSDSML